MRQAPPEGSVIVSGYKATDADIQCLGYQFEVGAWHKHEGQLVECKSGFHFCEQPSGPWYCYRSSDTRVWRIEAADVLDAEWSPGADRKRVARYIRLVEEVSIGDNWSAGGFNNGDYNNGDYNTGDYNTGDYNTGGWNTGNYNSGDSNTGDGNSGNWNAGFRNSGNRNTGGYNAGSHNAGDYNTGYGNTGGGNATDFSAGYFCQEPQTVVCFDRDTGLSRDEFAKRYGAVAESLALRLQSRDPIPFDEYAALPGITPEKLASLHAKHLAAKEQAK